MILNLVCATGQSPMTALNPPSGGNISTVEECGVWEQYPKSYFNQTSGMKYVGPGHADWPYRSEDDPPRVMSGIDYTYCRRYRQENPTHQQILVRQAAGGQPASAWLYENMMVTNLRNAWDACMRSTEMALWGPRCANTLLISQGEKDYQIDGDKWVSQWLSILDSFRRPHGNWQYPIVGDHTRIGFCETPANSPLNARNADLPKLATYGVKLISADGIVPHDGIHADAVGLQTMGVRAYATLHA